VPMTVLALSALWSTSVALANDGPSPDLFAEQSGPDVELMLRLHEGGEPGIDSQLDLARDGEPLLTDHRFSRDDAVASDWYCGGGDSVMYGPLDHMIDCEVEPEYCEDCGDSDVMCPIGGCYEMYDIPVVDACVPEGEHTWTLQQHGSSWVPASVTLDVQPSDEACDDTGEGDGSSGGCGCQSASATPGLALGLLMLGIGVLARPRR